MSQTHVKLLCFFIFRKEVEESPMCPKLKGHMLNLCTLMGIHYLRDAVTYGYDCNYFKQGSSDMIEEAFKIMLAKIRP
jgi:hypothetical protein